MNGFLMSLGGYINHRRCCAGVLGLLTETFFFLVAIVIYFLMRSPSPRPSPAGRGGNAPSLSRYDAFRFKMRLRRHYGLAAGDGGDDADFVAVLERGLAVLEEANVLLVDVDVDEAANLAFFIDQT